MKSRNTRYCYSTILTIVVHRTLLFKLCKNKYQSALYLKISYKKLHVNNTAVLCTGCFKVTSDMLSLIVRKTFQRNVRNLKHTNRGIFIWLKNYF